MKIALFLDVDKTLTRDFIQHIYAKALGVEAEYQELEDEFQLGLNADKAKAKNGISSAEFGTGLSKLFAAKRFTRAKAEDLFHNVDLWEHVDDIFKWQDKGIAIYLVSSGPNYYIDILARRNGIPPEKTKSSTYYFRESDGVIYKCNSVNAQDKHDFVQREIKKYDLTIGIGDSDQHDTFVSLCTISMYTTMQKDYIHLTQFSAVSRMLEKLLEQTGPSDTGMLDADTWKKISLKDAFGRLSAGLWVVIVGLIIASFTFGYSTHDFFQLKNTPAQAAQSAR
jgi:phosphoserine phosphatase